MSSGWRGTYQNQCHRHQGKEHVFRNIFQIRENTGINLGQKSCLFFFIFPFFLLMTFLAHDHIKSLYHDKHTTQGF